MQADDEHALRTAELLFEDEYEAGLVRPSAGQRTVLHGEILKTYIVMRAPRHGPSDDVAAAERARREFRRRWEQRASTLQVEVQLQLLARGDWSTGYARIERRKYGH